MKHFGKYLNRDGASLIETMIAFAIFGIMVVTLFPIFSDIQKIGRNTNVRRTCQQVVTSKLESYKTGLPLTLSSYLAKGGAGGVAPNAAQLKALSLESYSDGANGSWDSASGDRVLSGFSYAKIRYNHFFPDSCIGPSAAIISNNVPQMKYLGIRECIASNKPGDPPAAWVDATPDSNQKTLCLSTTDKRIQSDLPGFKLYVKLELETPWKYNTNQTAWMASGSMLGYPLPGDIANISAAGDSTPNPTNRLHDHCPNFGNIDASTTSYDFSGQSDGIKITVTGIVDYKEEGLNDIGGMTNWSELSCQASAIITPYRYPARYMLTSQNKIYSVHGMAWNKSTEADASGNDASGSNVMVFKNIYNTGTAAGDAVAVGAKNSSLSTSILSFSVHPRDAAIWVLRPGLLTRYSNCSGTPVNCAIGDDATNGSGGFPDNSQWYGATVPPALPTMTTWPAVQTWNVSTGITSIGVDYKTGKVYGFAKSQSGGVILDLSMQATHTLAGKPLGACNDSPSCTPDTGGSTAVGGSADNLFRTEVASRGIDCQQYQPPPAAPVPVSCPVTVPPATSPVLPADVIAEFPRPYFVNLPSRVNSFFMSPSGDAVFVTDNTASIVFGDEVYSSSVYRVTDEFLTVPIMTLPFFVTAFSM